jgi:uncharacterized membrane protein HdeD (DUF308 family)
MHSTIRDVTKTRTPWTWMLGWAGVTIVLAFAAFLLPEIQWAAKGGVVGWLLLIAGLAEVLFAAGVIDRKLRTTAFAAGSLTAAAGLIFVFNPFASYFPVANVVMLWLGLRGIWIVARTFPWRPRVGLAWLASTGLTDLLLALMLAAGLPVAVLVVKLFGPTPEILARFSLILATSFLVTGISQAALALLQRHR